MASLAHEPWAIFHLHQVWAEPPNLVHIPQHCTRPALCQHSHHARHKMGTPVASVSLHPSLPSSSLSLRMPSLLPLPVTSFRSPSSFLSPSPSPLSPAHHILLQPINNFWAIAPGPCWARPLARRCPAQPLSATAASSKVQRGFHSPAPRQGVEEAAGKERPRCQGAWHRKRGSLSPPRGPREMDASQQPFGMGMLGATQGRRL